MLVVKTPPFLLQDPVAHMDKPYNEMCPVVDIISPLHSLSILKSQPYFYYNRKTPYYVFFIIDP